MRARGVNNDQFVLLTVTLYLITIISLNARDKLIKTEVAGWISIPPYITIKQHRFRWYAEETVHNWTN